MKDTYIYSSLATFSYINGKGYASNPIVNLEVECTNPSGLIFSLIEFCMSPKTYEQIISRIQNALNFSSKAHCVNIFEYMAGCGLIIDYNMYLQNKSFHLYTNLDERDVNLYLSSRRSIPHADYNLPSVYREDEDLMKFYFRDNDYPCLSVKHKYKQILHLCHPSLERVFRDNFSEDVSKILFWNFGILRQTVFLEFLPIYIKPVPSKGARHPFEVYIIAPNADDLLKGDLYHYHAKMHALGLIKQRRYNLPQNVDFVLLISVVFERFQWRYRHYYAYKDIFYDLGHLVGNIKYVAIEIGKSFDIREGDFPFDCENSFTEEKLLEIIFYKKGN